MVTWDSAISGWSIANAKAGAGELIDDPGNNQRNALLNFLSLYALTRNTGDPGTWSLLPVKNDDAGNTVRNALFGSGAADDEQLIQNVFIGSLKKNNAGQLVAPVPYVVNGAPVVVNGQNRYQQPYTGINAVLGQLGFGGWQPDANLHHGPMPDHHHHFHIDLRAPLRQGITQNLLADDNAAIQAARATNDATIANAQALLDLVKADLNLTSGEVTMFIPDMPNLPPQNVPVMIAQADQANAPDRTATRAVGICRPAPNNSYSIANLLSPMVSARGYFKLYEQRTVSSPATTTVVQQPKHGVLRLVTEADRGVLFDSSAGPLRPDLGLYAYLPEPGYVGKDNAAILVDFGGGNKVKVQYYFQAIDEPILVDSWMEDYCSEKGPYWKISSTLDTNGNSTIKGIDYLTAASSTTDMLTSSSLNDWLSLAQLDGKIADLPGINVSVADLTGGAVGQTVGTTITLDTNAAGYNWFIDPTPADNSEYLPTSNPYEWVAKVGTAAYGKMDMLSVLLHEYGHALGIEHSADNHDYMATTLTPGVRRMPSAEEMALMQQLVAQAKDGLASNNTQDNAPTPFPTLPFGTTLSLAFLGRLRNTRYGGLNIEGVLPYAPTTQYAVAANATFANLDTPAGWNTQGSVDIASGTSTATLSEVSTSQTRLSQVFMLNEQDRYLSFTLSGAALDDLNGAPDDAFEVALLDANTGLSVLGGNGLTRTDSFLNLQGDGTQHASDCVTCTYNSDGSRTYRVDLSGVARNTAVNLSFDLLGFGQDNSYVTLSDIRVSGLPQLHDDAASLPEDNLLTFDPFAQADSQLKPLLAAHIVDAPTHGSLAVNADGTFAYTPILDYYGTDSFSYRLSDGPLDSNLAMVSLTVTPVNDAPVAADASVALAEDGTVIIDLMALASDVDNIPHPLINPPLEGEGADAPSLSGGRLGWGWGSTIIVDAPAHGVLTQNADGTYSYTPYANYNGADSFTYRVNDGALDSNIATITLAITSVNDAPVAADTQAATDEDTPLNLNLLAAASDVDGDVLTPVIIAGPLHGQLIQNADGTFTYLSDPDYSGTDSFTYQVREPQSSDLSPLSSGIVTITLAITPVADAPSLALAAPADGYGASMVIFATGWETAPNRNTNSTVLPQNELEGWRAITPAGDANNHFIVWSSGDKMKDADNKNSIVYAAQGNQDNGGNTNWIELADAQGNGHETYGIERTVETRAGVAYTLSLDYAGRLGYDADHTRIGIYVDGVKIASHAGTSANTAINWEALTFSFTGTGAAQIIRIVTEAPLPNPPPQAGEGANEKGNIRSSAMIDNIALTEYLPINTGYQDGPIRLTAILAALTDTDGSETLGVTVAAIPTGATLTDGINSFTATDNTHIVAVTGWNLASLSITAPAGYTGQFALTVAATSIENATGEISNLAVTLPVTVRGQMTDDGGQITAVRPVEGQELAEGRGFVEGQITAVRADPSTSSGLKAVVEAHGVTRATSATITVRSDPEQPQAPGIQPGAELFYDATGLHATPRAATDQNRGMVTPIVIDWNARPTTDQTANPKKTQTTEQPANWLHDFLGITPTAPVSLAESINLSVTLPKREESSALNPTGGQKGRS